MICPLAPIVGLLALLAAGEALLRRDRKGRALAWLALLALVAGWLAYAFALRIAPVRVALEAATVLALALGAWRIVRLARRGELDSRRLARLARAPRSLASALRDPWVLAAHVGLLAMLTFAGLGRARFAAWEYALATAVTGAALAVHGLRARRRRMGRAEFGALESFAGAKAAAACPAGFGAATAAGGERRA